jgi:phosphoglycolate phosphatase
LDYVGRGGHRFLKHNELREKQNLKISMSFCSESCQGANVTSFRTALFDLDGTLLDHFAAIHAAHAHTLQQLGLPPPTMEQVRGVVGGGLEMAIRRLIGEGREELVTRAVPIYRTFWDKNMLHGVALLPGAKELLQALNQKDVQCAVFTNKHGPSARIVCDHLGIRPLLDHVFGALDTPYLKPQPEFALHALKLLSAKPETTCLVGDSTYDVEAARNGGFPCYCVTTGTHSAGELRAAGAAGVYDDLTTLGRVVFSV